MPKAAVNKYNFSLRTEDKVRFAWQVARVEAKAVTHLMNQATDAKLRLHTRTFDFPHVCRSLNGIQLVHSALFPQYFEGNNTLVGPRNFWPNGKPNSFLT